MAALIFDFGGAHGHLRILWIKKGLDSIALNEYQLKKAHEQGLKQADLAVSRFGVRRETIA